MISPLVVLCPFLEVAPRRGEEGAGGGAYTDRRERASKGECICSSLKHTASGLSV